MLANLLNPFLILRKPETLEASSLYYCSHSYFPFGFGPCQYKEFLHLSERKSLTVPFSKSFLYENIALFTIYRKSH